MKTQRVHSKYKVCRNQKGYGCGKRKSITAFSYQKKSDTYKALCRSCMCRKTNELRESYGKANDLKSDDLKIIGKKHCPGCNSSKPKGSFGFDRSRKDGLTIACRNCMSESRLRFTHKKLGLLSYVDVLLPGQTCTCNMCGDEHSRFAICLDHDKKSGSPRGYLCRGCNFLMHCNITIDRLKAYQRYIQSAQLSRFLPEIVDIEIALTKRRSRIDRAAKTNRTSSGKSMATCTDCRESKPIACFMRCSRNKRIGVSCLCKSCDSMKQARRIMMAPYLKKCLDLQGGCATCKSTTSRRWCVDHKHGTEVIRGILCDQCNRDLAAGRDDPRIFGSGISYLKNPPIQIFLRSKDRDWLNTTGKINVGAKKGDVGKRGKLFVNGLFCVRP